MALLSSVLLASSVCAEPGESATQSDSAAHAEQVARVKQGLAEFESACQSVKTPLQTREAVWDVLALTRDIADAGDESQVKTISELVAPLLRRSGDQLFKRDLSASLKNISDAIELRNRVQSGKATPSELALYELLVRDNVATAIELLRGSELGHLMALADAEQAALNNPGKDICFHAAKMCLDVAGKQQGLLKQLSERRALRYWAKAASVNPPAGNLGFRRKIEAACMRDLPVHKLGIHFTMNQSANGAVTSETGRIGGETVANPLFGPGPLGQAVALDGREQYLRIPKFDSGPQFSMSTWLKCTLKTEKTNCIVSNDGSGMYNGFGILVLEDGRLTFRSGRKPERRSLDTAAPCIISDQWHHVAFTFNGPEQRFTICVDGEQQEFVGGVIWDFPTDGEWRIGGHVLDRLDFPFCGMIDDFRIYSRELNRHEVRQLSAKY